jgi:hypothetical protein
MLQCNMKLPFLHRVNPCLKPVSVGCNRGLLLLPRLDRKTAAAVNSHARSDFLKFERRWLYLARGFESEMQGGEPVTANLDGSLVRSVNALQTTAFQAVQ